MNIEKVEKIFQILSENNPNPKTELSYNNNLTLLIAVVLSARSTDISVNKATKDLFVQYNTVSEILKLGEDGIKPYISSIGLYHSKASNIIKLCRILKEKYQFETDIPTSFEELINLPGVGRKTANVVLNCAFGTGGIAVDTHVLRVANRLGLTKQSSPDKVADELESIIPKNLHKNANHWLVLHGRYICKARNPLCSDCKINLYCEYIRDNSRIEF